MINITSSLNETSPYAWSNITDTGPIPPSVPTSMDGTNGFTDNNLSSKDITVRRLYITIACLVALTLILSCVNWLIQGHKRLKRIRSRIKCLSEQQNQHVPPKYRLPRQSTEAGGRFNGLFVFNMGNTSNNKD